MTNVKKVFSFLSIVVFTIMAVDFLGFMAWALSGQVPTDSFYIGTITHHILTAIIAVH